MQVRCSRNILNHIRSYFIVRRLITLQCFCISPLFIYDCCLFNDIKTLFFSKQDVYCKYSMYLEADLKTEVKSGTRNPEFNYERTFSFERVPPKVTQSFRCFKLNASSFNSTFETREPNSFIGTMYHLKVLLCTVHFRVS